jgi:hypothetical protein
MNPLPSGGCTKVVSAHTRGNVGKRPEASIDRLLIWEPSKGSLRPSAPHLPPPPARFARPRHTRPRRSAASNEGAREARGAGRVAVGPEAPEGGARRLPTRTRTAMVATCQPGSSPSGHPRHLFPDVEEIDSGPGCDRCHHALLRDGRPVPKSSWRAAACILQPSRPRGHLRHPLEVLGSKRRLAQTGSGAHATQRMSAQQTQSTVCTTAATPT